ncbi:conserved hypothetical protein [Neospora caninum Liverpool]|uniref:Leucine rich repeat-containing protein n=1 Tax=Neospora caninum (strain Liverpool) TaxID=572307 RepID=F0VND3_NEOCL|nr:conserved hypothetical protein [Neospora caninum Liverpool]CBZ55229.1 conserved hypothetical protein [Neospora caninum Liverpool]|eukprot:XP_003885257.1 conserved hypothetical protein [Neospora caninum Liverpool]
MLEVTSCVRKGGTHAPVHARRRDESEQQAASEDREKENRSNVNTVIVEEPEQVNMTGKQGQTMQRNKAVKEEKKGRRDESEGTKPAGSNYLVDGNDADRIAFLETSKHSTNNKMEKKQMTILSFFSRLSSSSPSSLSAASSFLSFPCPSSPSAASSSSSSLSVRCSSSPPSSLPLFLVPSALSRVAPARAAAQKRETAVSGETTNERDKPPKKRRLCKDEDASAALQGCIPASPVKQTKERTRSEQSFVDDSKGKIFRKNPQAANESPGLAETDRRRHRTRHITEHRKRASPSSSAPSSASSPHSSSSSSSCSALSSLSFAPESEPDVAPVGLPDLPEELLQQILDCCPNECLLVSHALAAAVRRRRRVLRLTPLHSSEPKAEHFLAAIRGYPQLRLLEVVNAPSLPARFFESLANSRTSCFPQRLEVLVLRKCLRLTSRLVRAITTRLRRLRAVDLQDNSSLDYTSVVYLRTLPHLEEFLDLRGCTALDDSNAAVLASLVNLQVLVLSDTGVTSTTVSAVAENCRKLEMLDISRIARLSKPAALLIPLYLLHLTRLKLSKNSAVDDECVRDCLTRLKSLALLDVSHCWRVTSGFCMPPLPQIPDEKDEEGKGDKEEKEDEKDGNGEEEEEGNEDKEDGNGEEEEEGNADEEEDGQEEEEEGNVEEAEEGKEEELQDVEDEGTEVQDESAGACEAEEAGADDDGAAGEEG